MKKKAYEMKFILIYFHFITEIEPRDSPILRKNKKENYDVELRTDDLSSTSKEPIFFGTKLYDLTSDMMLRNSGKSLREFHQ